VSKIPRASRYRRRPHHEGVGHGNFRHVDAFESDAVRSPRELEQLERDAVKRVRGECSDVEWLNSYAVARSYDYFDVFIANGIKTAARVSAIIRTFGHTQTATNWDRFKELVRTLPGPS
jgi:hypothetical protein